MSLGKFVGGLDGLGGVIGLMLGLASVAVTGCSNNAFEVAAGPLSGKVGGQAWTLGTAESNPFLSASSDTFFVDAYAESFDPCGGGGSSVKGNQVILNVPKITGAFALGDGFTQTFFLAINNVNLGVTRGRIVVDEITDTTVRGGANLQVDTDNFVNGQFEAQICP
jgi:hypothetical protein